MISSTDLVALVVVGVLLPAAFIRPPFLTENDMSEHALRRWNYAYSMFAFGLLGFVDVVALRLLKPWNSFSAAGRGGVAGAAMLVLLVVAAVHLPPIVLRVKRRLAERWLLGTAAVVLGTGFGGFLAVDITYPRDRMPLIGLLTWGVLLACACGATVWFSGLSPETKMGIFRLRRRRRLAKRS